MRYTRKFTRLISSFKEFWSVRAVRIIFFLLSFVIGKTDEKLNFLYIVAFTLKSWLTYQFVLRYLKYLF